MYEYVWIVNVISGGFRIPVGYVRANDIKSAVEKVLYNASLDIRGPSVSVNSIDINEATITANKVYAVYKLQKLV